MDFWHAAVLGLVEGLTEFIPVSSTGHMILASRLMGLPSSDFLKTFEIAIQSGAMIAIILLYGRRFLVEPGSIVKVGVAFVPTAVLGLLLHKQLKAFLDLPHLVLASLFVGGLALIALEAFYKESKCRVRSIADLSLRQAAAIGLCQTLAFVPGVSRSGATIGGGLVARLDRATALEFSFLLAAPTLLAATGFDLIRTSPSFTPREWALLATGFAVSFVVAVATVRLIAAFVNRFGFRPFGYYRILAACALWFVLK